MCTVASAPRSSESGRCLSLADYVMGAGATRGASGAEGVHVDYAPRRLDDRAASDAQTGKPVDTSRKKIYRAV